jgi:hypothetical protein
MLLPESVLDALIDDNASGIRFFCSDKEKQKEIAEYFTQQFEQHFEEQKVAFEEEIGIEPDEIDVPLISEPEYYADHVLLTVLPLDMSANDGVRAFNEFGVDAFNQSIEDFQKKYPDIEFDGCIQYAWCDEHCGDTVSFELGDEKAARNKVYDFVGRKLEASIAFGDFLDELSWYFDADSEDKDTLLKLIDVYGEYLSDDSKKNLREVVEEL